MLDLTDLRTRIAGGEMAALARGITLVESRRADHRATAADLIDALLPRTGNAVRIGMTGVPGVGKSTLIDSFGSKLTAEGHNLAVLTVDPSSARTGGSILGDKTRMARLASDPKAFVRPSPTAGTLGGVAAKTREAMLLCEAAGFDVVMVETVGIGQSETAVADMVDVFVALMLPVAGDELQGIKKGVLEIADVIAVNKAEGENRERAGRAAAEYRSALRILFPNSEDAPPVLTVSGLAGDGLGELWSTIRRLAEERQATGRLARRRSEQNVRWFRAMLDEQVRESLLTPQRTGEVAELERQVREGGMAATTAAQRGAALLLGKTAERESRPS